MNSALRKEYLAALASRHGPCAGPPRRLWNLLRRRLSLRPRIRACSGGGGARETAAPRETAPGRRL